jgi:hypothetical protein
MTLDNIAESLGTLESEQQEDDHNRMVSEDSTVEKPESTAEDMWSPKD